MSTYLDHLLHMCVCLSHISINSIGRKLTNATLLLVSITTKLYHFLKKMWEGGHPWTSKGDLPAGRGKTLQELVECESEEGLGRLYCNSGPLKW